MCFLAFTEYIEHYTSLIPTLLEGVSSLPPLPPSLPPLPSIPPPPLSLSLSLSLSLWHLLATLLLVVSRLTLLGCVGPISACHSCTASGLASTRTRMSSLEETRLCIFAIGHMMHQSGPIAKIQYIQRQAICIPMMYVYGISCISVQKMLELYNIRS